MSDFLLLESDDDESNDYAESEVPKIEDGEPEAEVSAKKRRGKFEYESLKTLTTKEELEEYQQLIKSEGMHRKHEFNGVYERIYTYECKETRRGCKYVLIIRSPHDSSKSTVSHRVCGHDHSNSKLMKQIKEFLSASSAETIEYELPVQEVHENDGFEEGDTEEIKALHSLEEFEADGFRKKSMANNASGNDYPNLLINQIKDILSAETNKDEEVASSSHSQDPATTSKKRKRTTINLAEKLAVIEASKNKKISELCKEFGHPETTIRSIIKDKNRIMEALNEGKNGKRGNLRGARHSDLENAMVSWLKEVRNENISINGPLLKKKATAFAKSLNIDGFVASNGWLDNFKKRHGINGFSR